MILGSLYANSGLLPFYVLFGVLLRPGFNIEVPQLVLYLIKSCLDANPLNRPNAKNLTRIFNEWRENISAYIKSIENKTEPLIKTEIVKQLEETEKINDSSSASNLPSIKNMHPGAIYTSRLLNFNNLPEPKTSNDYYETYDNISSVEYSGI